MVSNGRTKKSCVTNTLTVAFNKKDLLLLFKASICSLTLNYIIETEKITLFIQIIRADEDVMKLFQPLNLFDNFSEKMLYFQEQLHFLYKWEMLRK